MTAEIKTRTPVNAFLLLALSALLITLIFFNIFWAIYVPIIWILFYVFFCRYCCKVTISYHHLEVTYFALWLKNIKLDVQNIINVDYAKGYYDLSAKKTITQLGLKMFPLYPYDRLIIFLRNSTTSVIYVNINTMMFDFDKILAWAKENKLLVK